MLYKSLMTKETYEDLLNYLETGDDAISLMGYKRENYLDGTKLVKRFQTTADIEVMGRVRNFNSNDVLIGVPKYAENGYSSFVVRDKGLSLRLPMQGSLGSIEKYFSESERTCPNFKDVVNQIQNAFNIKVKDNERITKPITVHGNKVRIAGRYNGEQVSEPDKLVQLFNLLAKGFLKDNFKKTTNPERVQFASEILTTMFIAESYDLGANFNKKIDNALRLQFSNVISALGNASKETINLIAIKTEKAVAKFMKKSGKTPNDIVKTLKRLGYDYVKTPTDLYGVLFGERKNYMFNIEVPNAVADKILGKTIIYNDDYKNENSQTKTQSSTKYEIKKAIEGYSFVKGEDKTIEASERKLLHGKVENFDEKYFELVNNTSREEQKNESKKTPDVIILPSKLDENSEKIDVDLPKETLEQFASKLIDEKTSESYMKAVSEKIGEKTKKGLFGGKFSSKTGVSERTLKTAFDKAVIQELDKVLKNIAVQFRKEKGLAKDKLSEVYNQLTHAKQFFGKGSDRKDIKAISSKIEEAKKVKIGLVKPLEERRKAFISSVMAYQEHLKTSMPDFEIKATIKNLSDTSYIRKMIENYVSSQKDDILVK